MNARSYKTVFSKRLGTLVAVGEHASSQGKANGAGSGGGAGASATLGYIAALTAGFAFVSLAWAAPANNALPTSGTVVQGAASMAQSANQLNITQSTQRAAINWQSFDIGSQARVQVYQPNAQSVLLNRVVGNTPSQIFGHMQANGHVILVNPNGVLFGKDGSVNAGSFTASTLNISDANFMAGNMVYERNGSTAGIVNQGNITTAPGGYVALLGATVSNEGNINTHGGSVVMGAGETIKVPVSGTGRIKLELTPAAINASVSNSGSIVTEGGQVYMQALALNRAAAQIIQSGSIDTTGAQGGAVHLLADGGQIKVDGSITANSTGKDDNKQPRKGGDIVIGRDEDTGVLAGTTNVTGAKLESQGGFVETSGQYLVTTGVSVKAKDWLLDPTDINIVAVGTLTPDTPSTNVGGFTVTTTFTETAGINTSKVLTGTIQTAINNGTNVTISTENTAVGANGSGNITIFDKLNFANNSGQDATLTLLAKNGITQNSGATIIQTAGTNNNKVNVVMTSEGLHMGVPGNSASSRGITLQAAITTNGDVTLSGTTNNSAAANGSSAIGVDIKSAAVITAKNIKVTGKSENSFGIQSASALNATGDITLEGTSKNWVGVVTTGAVTAGGALNITGKKTTAAGFQGVNINSAVKGASVTISGESVGHYGVGVGTLGSVESTTGDVSITGTGTGDTTLGTNNNAAGVQVQGAITAKGKLSITGTKNGSGGYQGINLSGTVMKGDTIEITGTSNAWDAVTFTNATLTATKTLKVDADSTAVGKGILFSGGSTNTITADSYLVKAKTATNNGIYFNGTTTFNSTSTSTASLIDVTRTTSGGDTISTAGTVNINSGTGKATLQTSTTTDNLAGGIRINGGSTVNTTGDVTIGSKNSNNVYTFNQGTINAQGNLTLLGQVNSSSGVMAGVWLQGSGGTGAKIVGTNGANITIDGTSLAGSAGVNLSVNSSANSITTTGTTSGGAVGNISITGTSASGHGISNAAAEVKNTSTNSSTGTKGNVTLTGTTLAGTGQGIYNVALGTNANKNAIYAAGNLTLTGNSVNGNAVNTTGTLEAGGLLKIEGTATPLAPLANATSIGIYVGNTVKGGTVSMTGTTGGSKGIDINGAVASTVGDITLKGTGGGNYYYSQGVLTGAAGTLNSVAGIKIEGSATGAGNNLNAIGTQIQGAVTAAGDILIKGNNGVGTTNPNYGVSIEKAINSTGGNITVTAESTSGTKAAFFLSAAGSLLTDVNSKAININTNGMDLNAAATVKAGTSGTGTVNIKTTGTTNNIVVGGADVGNNLAASQVLGITNAELNQITAGNVVIGDTGKSGNITVSGTVSTASGTGNITLQTGGNIAVNAALTVSDAVTPKNLTLNGAGAASAISQNAAGVIKAAGLELLGANATHTLTNVGNQVTTLAANSKAVNYVNSAALTLGAVNATTGVNATGDVSIATQTGHLTVAENVSTTATSATALVLNAGKSAVVGAAVGADLGGNIVVSSDKTVIAGSGGVVQLMTGSIAGSTSAAGLATTGNFRYNSDESNTNYNTALSSGVNVIYREKPTLTVNVNSVSKTYDGLTFTGGNGFTEVTPSGLKNGDGLTGATATAVYGGTAQNAKNASSTPYTLSASESITGKSALGYGVTYNSGTLTVGKADLSVALADQTKTYDGTTAATLAPAAFTVKGVTVAGQTETASVNQTVAFYNDKNVLGASSVTANLAAGNFAAATGTDLNNYNLPTTVTGKGTITPRPLTIAVGTVADKTADGTTTATVTPGALGNLVTGENLGVSATGNFNDANVGNGKVVTASYTLRNSTNGLASNYILNASTPNPDSRLRGNILASVNPVINPTPSPVNNNTGSRVSAVSGFGGSGAATGVLDDKPVTESREVCSDVFPENCECQPSVIPSIEICFAPKRVAASKDEK